MQANAGGSVSEGVEVSAGRCDGRGLYQPMEEVCSEWTSFRVRVALNSLAQGDVIEALISGGFSDGFGTPQPRAAAVLSETDPESRIAKMKDGRTHLANQAEHVVDLDTELILAAEIYPADAADVDTIGPSISHAQDNLLQAASDAQIEEAVAACGELSRADKGYSKSEKVERSFTHVCETGGNDLQALRQFLDAGEDPNSVAVVGGFAPLYNACFGSSFAPEKSLAAVRLLLERGAETRESVRDQRLAERAWRGAEAFAEGDAEAGRGGRCVGSGVHHRQGSAIARGPAGRSAQVARLAGCVWRPERAVGVPRQDWVQLHRPHVAADSWATCRSPLRGFTRLP